MQIKNLFFSYSRADGADFALRLAVDLQREGFNVWIDQQDIRAGSEWDLEIEKALETCDCLLFIESEKSVVSTNVLDEVYYALEQGKRVIPVVLVDSKTPFRLKRLQHINFATSYDKGLAHLVKELKSDQLPELPANNAGQVPITKNPPYKRLPVVLGGILILLIAIAGYAYFSNGKSQLDTGSLTKITETDTLKPGSEAPVAIPLAAQVNDTAIELEKKLTPRRLRRNDTPAKEVKARGNKPPPPVPAKKVVTSSDNEVVLLAETFAGNWQLSGVSAPARGYRGYLNIEDIGDNRVKILSSFQFNFIKANDTAYFEVFNGFASCASCIIKKEMPVTENDVAFGAQIYRILRTDVEGEGRAGDTVSTIGPNKSINASVILHLVDKNSALIKVHRLTAVPMAYGMVIPPFDYTFRFTRKGL